MAGVAQVWLSEDELDFLVKATVRYAGSVLSDRQRFVRQNLLDKLRPLAHGTSCEDGSCRIEEGPVPTSLLYQQGYDDGFEDGYQTGWAAAGRSLA